MSADSKPNIRPIISPRPERDRRTRGRAPGILATHVAGPTISVHAKGAPPSPRTVHSLPISTANPILTNHPRLCKPAVGRLPDGRYFTRSVKCLSGEIRTASAQTKLARDHFCIGMKSIFCQTSPNVAVSQTAAGDEDRKSQSVSQAASAFRRGTSRG